MKKDPLFHYYRDGRVTCGLILIGHIRQHNMGVSKNWYTFSPAGTPVEPFTQPITAPWRDQVRQQLSKLARDHNAAQTAILTGAA